MALRMIDFRCKECTHEFEECVETKDGLASPEKCPKCGHKAIMIMNLRKRIHRDGNRYRDVSWSTWNVS